MTQKKQPMRKCIGCQEMRLKKELTRVIRTPEGEICIDATGKKNGRGAYLCRSMDCLMKASKTKGLERAFQCVIPNEIYLKLEKELKELGKE